MWERQGRAVKDSELGQPAKEVRKRGAKDEPTDSRAAEEEAEVRKPAKCMANAATNPVSLKRQALHYPSDALAALSSPSTASDVDTRLQAPMLSCLINHA